MAKKSVSEIAVTLAPALFDRLEAEARRMEVSLEWLVASLVVDTLEEASMDRVLALA